MSHNEHQHDKQTDPRPKTVASIGGLGVCIPLCAIIGSYSGLIASLLPLAVIIGAAATMLAV